VFRKRPRKRALKYESLEVNTSVLGQVSGKPLLRWNFPGEYSQKLG
jgi:hypothetical protein